MSFYGLTKTEALTYATRTVFKKERDDLINNSEIWKKWENKKK